MSEQLRPHARCPGCDSPLAPAARFCSACGRPQGAAPVARPRRSAAGPRARELRPMTVVFCDVVGTSAFASDPEEFSDTIARFHALVAEVTAAQGGRLGQLIGDEALLYFGYPAAQEDDAERAVLAALRLLDAVAGLSAPGGAALRLRVGIATGLVVVAGPSESGALGALDVFGETPNLAARLLALAQPGSILVSDSVRQQIDARFDLLALGPQAIRGWPEPLPVWQVLRPAADRDRFGPRRRGAALPLVGRAAPLRRLHELLAAARAGDGRMVLVQGEAGIGKSRLVAQLQDEAEGVARLRFFAAPHEQGMPLRPVLRAIERLARARGGAPSLPENLEVLRDQLPDESPEDVALVAQALGLGTGRPLPLPPPQLRERVALTILGGLRSMTRHQPLLVVFEDAHWADPTTREVLAAIAPRLPGEHMLFIVTARPEFAPSWAASPVAERLVLEPLATAPALDLVRAVARDLPLPQAAVHDILWRADGVPLFIEELTRAVAEQVAQGADPGSDPAPGTDPAWRRIGERASVPVSLHASLLARLDRLGEARQVAEVAAVIGREIAPPLLALALDWPDDALAPLIERLVGSGILQRSASGGLRFRHALILDAALGMLPRDRYRTLHARVADLLEERFAGTPAAAPQILAHHRTEAGEIEKATGWWLRGAQESMTRFAMQEAIDQLRAGIALFALRAPTEAAMREELEMQLLAGNALLSLHGHSAAEIGAAYDRARELSSALPGQPQLRVAMHGQWSHAWMRGRIALSLQRADALLAEAEQHGGGNALTVAYSARGHSLFLAGRFAEAEEALRRSLAQFDPEERDRRHLAAAAATLVSTRCYSAWAETMTGRVRAGQATAAAALTAARASRVPFPIGNALYALSRCAYEAGDAPAAIAHLRETLTHCEENGVAFLAMAARPVLGVLLGRQGEVAEGLRLAREAIAWCERMEALAFVPNYQAIEAELLARAGDAPGALTLVDTAIAAMTEQGTLWEATTLHRQRAEILLRLDRAEEAEAGLRTAVATATSQGAHLFRLRATLPLATLLRRVGRAAEATEELRAALAPLAGEAAPAITAAQEMLDGA